MDQAKLSEQFDKASEGGERSGAGYTATYETVESDVEPIADFDSMGLRDELLRGIYAYGFEKPSAIQQRAIVPLSQGKDIIAQGRPGPDRRAHARAGPAGPPRHPGSGCPHEHQGPHP